MEASKEEITNTASLDHLKSLINEDLEKISEKFMGSISRVRNKLYSQIEVQKVIYDQNVNNFNEFKEKHQETLDEDSKEYFDFMTSFYEASFKRSAKYIRIDDVSHTFHQVIQVLNKALMLFEDHIEDLLSLPNYKEFNPENYFPRPINEARNHALSSMPINEVKVEFKGFVETEHEYPLNNMILLDNDTFATSSLDKSVHIYSLSLNKKIGIIKGFKNSPTSLLAISLPDSIEAGVGKERFRDLRKKKNKISPEKPVVYLATGGGDFDPNIYIWNYKTSEKIITLPGHTRHITSLCQLPDKNIIVSASYDSKLYFWSLTKAEPLFIQNNHTFWIIDIRLMSCLNKLATASWDRSIIIWKLNYEQKVSSLVFKDVKAERTIKDEYETILTSSIVSNPDLIISSNIGSHIKLWDIKTGKLKSSINLNRGFAIDFMTIESLKSTDDEFFIAVILASEGGLKIYSSKTQEIVARADVENFSINTFNLSPKMQFFKNSRGNLGILAVNHADGKFNLCEWEIILS